MRPRFQADADLNQKIVRGVRRREPSVDFQDAHQGGVIALSDPEVLRVATALGRIVVSHDRKTMPGHFGRFIERSVSSGLIIVSQDLDISAAIEDILLIWLATTAAEWMNKIGFIPV